MNHPLDKLFLDGRQKLPLVQQSEASECGLACIAMIAGYHGYTTDMANLRRRFGLSLKGATLKDLIDICGAIGFNTRPVRGDLDNIADLELPAILHWNLNHFVVLKKVDRGWRGTLYHIHDPVRGVQKLSIEQFSRHWTGVALEVAKAQSFKPKVDQTGLRISQLWSSSEGFWKSFSHVLLLSLVLQLIVLASPFYM